ncbi:hypothetical protein [uncultured Polaribacter sp.]|uniref:hypothetical protein n=1 Tax=uncultured Polaribacter sp. TaxID=174711 RepID=UPI002603F737|nr:hypothetical protein [uncultured Polaribacter sp.]
MDNNSKINFSLKGFTSILIGGYFFIAGYLIETILKGFLIDDHALAMFSAEIIEYVVLGIAFLVFQFSSLAIYFSGKRNATKLEITLWNAPTKNAVKKYFLGVLVIFSSLIILMNLGFIDYITPTFLILYGFLLFVFKNEARKNLLVLSGLSLLLALMCFLIPTYWASSLSILGIAHITYGFVVKE